MNETTPSAGYGASSAGAADTPALSSLRGEQTSSPIRQPSMVALPRVSRTWIIDVLLFCVVAALLYVLLTVAPAALRRPSPSVTIDLRPAALPAYTVLSLLRMVWAYVSSLIFTLVVGYAAARNRRAERVLIPILDILQSIPVLSFLPAVLLAMIAVFHGTIGVTSRSASIAKNGGLLLHLLTRNWRVFSASGEGIGCSGSKA